MTVTSRGDTPELPPPDQLAPPSGRLAWLRLSIPVVGVLVGLATLLLWLEGEFRRDVFTFLGTYMLPGGIDYGIPLARGLGVQPLWILGLITYFDLWITAFWVWNLDHLARFRAIETRVEKSRARAHRLWARYPRLRVVSGPGLALFITLPIPWTGSFAGIVIGKLLELPDLVIYVASIVGTAIRVAIFAFAWDAVFGLF